MYEEQNINTAAMHRLNFKELLEEFADMDADFICENWDTLAETARALETLNNYTDDTMLSIIFVDGMDYYCIKEV